MIAATSSRKLPRDVGRSLQPAFEQLQLPWLCPRLYSRAQSPIRPAAQRRATANVASQRPAAPSRVHTSPVATRTRPDQKRSYAYAASADHSAAQSDDFYIPLVPESQGLSQPWSHRPSLGSLGGVFSPLIIDDSTQLPKARSAEYNGVKDVADLHQNLEACLLVGLHERAATTMLQMNHYYKPDDPELLRVHNFFIGYMIGQYNNSSGDEVFHFIQKWYHVHMVGKGIAPDAATYAMMVQLMLRDRDSGRVARGVRKYVGAAENMGLIGPVVHELQGVVSPEDFEQILEIAPELATYIKADSRTRDSKVIQQPEMSEAKELEDEAQISWKDGLPHILPVEQKGEGLRALQQTVSALNSTEMSGSRQAEANILRQKRLEEDATVAALSRWRTENELAKQRGAISSGLQSKVVSSHMWQWHTQLVEAIQQELMDSSDNGGGRATMKTAYEPYLRFVSVARLSALTLIATLNTFALKHPAKLDQIPIARVVSNIGALVEQESAKEWGKLKQKNRFVLNAQAKGESNLGMEVTNAPKQSEGSPDRVQTRTMRTKQEMTSLSLEAPEWSTSTQVRVGVALLALLMKTAQMPAKAAGKDNTELPSRPAFTQTLLMDRGKKRNIIECDETLMRQLSSEPHAAALTKLLPMLTKPVPWSEYKKGAYLNGGVPAVRISQNNFQSKAYVKLAIDNGDMKQALAGLDVLGRVPWRVNRNVFGIMLEAWNSGEEIAGIAPLDPIVPFPETPSASATPREKAQYYNQKKEAQNKISGYHSNRCFQNFQLEVARAFTEETFYLPHNMDFRGRAYPIPPYLNHMGADHSRGLLVFAEGKELGAKGLDWLKIHLANVYGYDKASLSERRKFADEHLADILDSANNGLKGNKWWLNAEDPWQCLATCFELRDALSAPDPTKFISHLPVHQDGTCNGLQHYAALGGDEAGARQVNLEPGDRPSDIYTAVAEHVQGYVKSDVAKGLHLAKLLDGKVVRKIVKQTVMTNVYGVTFQGARLQVQARLIELYPGIFENEPYLKYTASTYLAQLIFRALSTIFNGASEIQKWLGQCASQICQSLTPEQMDLAEDLFQKEMGGDEGLRTEDRLGKKALSAALEQHSTFKSSVIWTTPLQMPVVQPYRAPTSATVTTSIAKINLVQPNASDAVSKRKQMQGFPPNFIHSLDATHMLLSAIQCEQLGLSFAAVHDSFWTHATDVDTMSSVLRDQFIRMHSDDIVGRLAAEFSARYKNNMYMTSVYRKSPIGKAIFDLRKAKYPSTKNPDKIKVMELLEERERQRLLSSEDPNLRRQGEDMMTPTRLYEEMKGNTQLMEPENPLESVAVNAAEDNLEDCFAPIEEPGVLESELANSSDDSIQAEPTSEAEKIVKQFKSRHASKAKNATFHQKINVWLPVAFPPVPEKGNWDVARLKQSKYFFS